MKNQRGYFLVLAVIFIFVMALMGTLISYIFANRARMSSSLYNGLQTFNIAESGLEATTRYITRPSVNTAPVRIACSSVTGTAELTNATMSTGQFTATATEGTVTSSNLSSAVTAAATSITVASTGSFAPQGRIIIDKESIDYAAISGNSFIGLTRGADGSVPSSHLSGVPASQFQCSITVDAAIPSMASASFQRELQWGVQLQDGLAVGDRSGSNYTLYRWNGETDLTWANDSFASCGSSCRANINAVSMLSYADGWAAGDRTSSGLPFLRWNGSTWTPSFVTPSCSGQNINGISMVSSQEGWAVGVRYVSGCGGGSSYRYTILKWNGSAWSLLSPAGSPSIPADGSSNQNLNAVHVIDTAGDGTGNIGFAVGNSGHILYYNGSSWTAATSPTSSNLFGINVVSASEAWAVGASGVILKWNGSTWSTVTSPTTVQLNAISMLDTDGDGLANFGVGVGNSGRIVTYNGSTWSTTTSSTNNLLAVAVLDDSDVWAAGASGRVTHWDGSSWVASTVSSIAINGLAFVAPRIDKTTGWQQVFH